MLLNVLKTCSKSRIWRKFGTSKMHLSPPPPPPPPPPRWLRLLSVLKAGVLLLLTCCLLLLPLWNYGIVLCFVVGYFMSILVLKSCRWGRESWLLCLVCLSGVSWLLCGSSSRSHGFVCCVWWSYQLTIFVQMKNSSFNKKVRKRANVRNRYNQTYN